MFAISVILALYLAVILSGYFVQTKSLIQEWNEVFHDDIVKTEA